jgi:hypothetical protein
MSQKTRRQQISRRALFITNVVLIVIPVLVVGLLIEIGAQPASRFRAILMVVFAVEAVIFLLPSSWLPSGGIRPMGTLITARELRTFMQENRALARDRPWGSERVAIGPAIAFVVTALSFVLAH